jgi:HEPN domain-containing protein
MSNTEKEALRWYLQGTRDARTAGRNSANGDFEVACFLYQQAAEKILKTFLYLSGENPVLGHSTLKLAERAAAYEDRFLQALDACRDLDVFYSFDAVHAVVRVALDPLAGNAQN